MEAMTVACYVEVEVNGEEVFWVDMRILSSFSGRLKKSLGKSSVTSEAKSVKIILHGIPGGAETFELIARFCYNQGRLEVNPANTCLLHFAAHFMEMGEDDESSSPNLVKQTDKSLDGVAYWSWSELLIALRQCQDDYCPFEDTMDKVLHKVLDAVVGRITATNETTSPSNSSPESSGFRFSFDTRSTTSTKNNFKRAWWFEDLVFLNLVVMEKIVKMMIFRTSYHGMLSRFLFYYFKSRTSIGTTSERRRNIEVVIDLLHSLDRTIVSCKSLFIILRMSLSLNISDCCRSKLDEMIGCQIGQATLDDILIPAPTGMDGLYDVSLVLRLCKSFLNGGGRSSTTRLKLVGRLVDLYLAEVAPDVSLKPQKFVSLAMILPDEARDSYDDVYRAVEMYIEVHADLSEEERMRICCVLNYEKLSSETCKHLTQNSKLPSRTAIQALVSQQSKLKSLLQETNNYKFLKKSPSRVKENHSESDEQVILYAKKLGIITTVENEKLKDHLQGMQWKVLEVEKISRKMQTQITKFMRTSSSKSSISLPKLCS